MVFVKLTWVLGLFVLCISVVKSKKITHDPVGYIGLPPMDLDEVEMHPETKKEQEVARLQSMYRSLKNGKFKPAKMPKAFDLEVYVYFGPSMIQSIGSESKAESMTKEMATQAKKWLADPSIGARINVIPTIKKINKDTNQLNVWGEMVPRES